MPLANLNSNAANKKDIFIDTDAPMSDDAKSAGPGSPSQTYALRHGFDGNGFA